MFEHTHAADVHCSTVYNSPASEACMIFVDRCMDTEIVHIYNGIFLSPEMNEMYHCSNIGGPREDHTK